MSKDCDIVRDLLPLYVEDMGSEETNRFVEKHIGKCEECKQLFENMKSGTHSSNTVSKENTADKNALVAIKRKIRNRTIAAIISVIAVFLLLVGGYFLQMQIPVASVSNNDINIVKAYRYQTDDGYKLFVITEGFSYANSTMDIDVSDNGNTLVLKMKRPFISQKSENRYFDTFVYDFGYETGDQGVIFQEFSTVKFGDNVIWSSNQNENDIIPDYVYAYDEFDKSTGQITGWIIEENENWIEADYNNGTFTRWNLEGDVIVDTHSK